MNSINCVLSIMFGIMLQNGNCNSVPSNQVSGLEYLYNHTNGWNWVWSSVNGHWNFTSSGTVNPCIALWEGVICNNGCNDTISSSCTINALNLTAMNLNGSIPVQLPSLLSELHTLVISNNIHLHGTIPTSINMFMSLTLLDLSYNSISGSIPTQLCELSSLKGLYLNNNVISHSLPTEIGKLLSLTMLMVSGNLLRGIIPSEIGQLINLKILYLYSNSLSGSIPSEICKLRNITLVDLFSNYLFGTNSK